jgi:O-antigen ligase
MTAPDFRTALRARGPGTWIALLGLGIALSPTHTKIAGAAWLLVCIAGAVVFFRLPRPVFSATPDAVGAASRAWVMACLVCAGLATGVWLYWPDPPDTLHAEFRLLLAAAATHQLIRRASDPEKWRAFTLPAVALACLASLGMVATTPDRLFLPSNAIPWAVSLAFLVCILLPPFLRGDFSPVQRRWYFLAIATGVIAILLSQSRAAYGILVWAVWLFATNERKAHPRIHLRNVAFMGVLAAMLLASSAWLPSDPLRLRLAWNEVLTAEQDGNYKTSMGARVYVWALARKGIQESPWIGVGGRERLRRLREAGAELPDPQRAQLAVVRKLGHVHNQYLHSAMDGGLIGLTSTLAVLAGLGAAAFALRRTDPMASRQMQGVLLLHATAGLTNVNLAHNYYAVMLSLSVAVILAGADARSRPLPQPA